MRVQENRNPGNGRRPSVAKTASHVALGAVRGAGWLAFALLWRTALVAGVVIFVAVAITYARLPDSSAFLDDRARGSVVMQDVHGEVFAWRGDHFAGAVDVDEVSPLLRNAVIATEDRRFYQHFGISLRGIASAIRINLSEGRGPLSGHGGSTITQQTAKLLCLGHSFDPQVWPSEVEFEADCREAFLWRKFREAVFAVALEARYAKAEILEIYLNRAYFGAGARGVEAASRRYFNVSASALDASQSAMLAGLLSAPSYYAPTTDLQRSQDRAAVVLRLMSEQGYLDDQPENIAPAVVAETAAQNRGEAFADWIMETGPDFLTSRTMEDVIVATTFDPIAQQQAEGALASVLLEQGHEASPLQAAIIVMSPDGEVRAMIGNRNFDGIEGQFNRAVHATRQTGSAFKPFVYAAALDMGYNPLATTIDEPITIRVPGAPPWTPRNFTRQHYGEVTHLEALSRSLNIPVVALSQEIGLEPVQAVARNFGITGEMADAPALVLGVSGASLLEMTSAYAGFLNAGIAVAPYGLMSLSLRGDDAPLMEHVQSPGERVISEAAAAQLVYMLHSVIETGTGRRAAIPGIELAGKTGTTQSHRDAWFIGFSGEYVVGVWVGNDDNSPLDNVTGGGLPAQIWRETMARLHEDIAASPLPMTAPGPMPFSQLEQDRFFWNGIY